MESSKKFWAAGQYSDTMLSGHDLRSRPWVAAKGRVSEYCGTQTGTGYKGYFWYSEHLKWAL